MRVFIVSTVLCLGLVAASSNAAEASASIGDGRTRITLTASERDYVLAGMREHVSQIQSIVMRWRQMIGAARRQWPWRRDRSISSN